MKAGDNRERAVVAAAAEEKDCSGKSDKRLGVMSEEGWQPQQTCKLVER